MSIVVRFSQATFNCVGAGGETDLHRLMFSCNSMMRKERGKMGWWEGVMVPELAMEYKLANEEVRK